MKGNQIDDLFRQKLNHQKLTPPPSAWGALEQNLPGKKKKGAYFWMSIAASLLVIATLGWMLLSGNASSPEINTPLEARQEPVKTSPATEQPAQTMVAEAREEPKEIKNEIEAPAAQAFKIEKAESLVASNNLEDVVDEEILLAADTENSQVLIVIAIKPLQINEHLGIEMSASALKFDMIMPLELSAFYIPYTEDLKLAPKKKKFRMLNGIISIAKEVNSGKLSFSELRNAKNNFVVDDLKYGSKEVDGDAGEGADDDKPDEPGKD